MKVILVLFVGLLVLIPVQTKADPSPEIEALMDQPVSMFDLGMWKLELRFEKQLEFYKEMTLISEKLMYFADVIYDWDDNKIAVVIRIKPLNDEPFGIEACKVEQDQFYELMTMYTFFVNDSLFLDFQKRGYSVGETGMTAEKLCSSIKIMTIGNYKDEDGNPQQRVCTFNFDCSDKMCSE